MISILIPFFADGPHRQRAFDWVAPRWQRAGFEVCAGADGLAHARPFSVNRALNDARSRATGERLVVWNCDSIPDPDHVESVVRDMGRAAWARPFARRVVLSEHATERVLAGADPNYDWPTHSKASGKAPGLVIVSADAWDALGGRDERFEGWGGEDVAFLHVLNTFYGPPAVRPRATVRDLWHPPTATRASAGNKALLRQHKAARGDVERMRQVLEGGIPRDGSRVHRAAFVDSSAEGADAGNELRL